jgi:Zn-dependent metalloprotease
MPLSHKLLPLAILTTLCGQAAAAVGDGAGTTPATGRALTLIQANPVATRATTRDAFIARDVAVDANGNEHVRFDRTYNGLRVLGGDLVVHAKGASFAGASLMLKRPLTLATTPTLTAAAAIARARPQFTSTATAEPTAALIVYARGTTPKLAYDTLFVGTRKDQTPTRMHYIVDALTGAVLARWDAVMTGIVPGAGGGTTTPAVGSGQSLLSGTVPLNTVLNSQRLFELKDTTRGGTWTLDYGNGFRDETATKLIDANNQWGNGARSDRATIAVDAAYGLAVTWDYYKNTFGRLGIGNDGVGTMTAVHYLRGYNNAFFMGDCGTIAPNGCMVFGDGDGVNNNPLVALDITGHEMSHGVTARTADLIYDGATGGLNEATSDILGSMVERYANNPLNPPNYTIGEKMPISNPGGLLALRYMFKPSLDGISPDCYPSTDPDYEAFFNTWLDVHYSSGVANHFFYLLAEGATPPAGFGLAASDLVCNGDTSLVGIGPAAAQQVWYRALTVYMTSTTDYAGARAATLSAAADLYGAGSARYNAVAAAWSAVSVN